MQAFHLWLPFSHCYILGAERRAAELRAEYDNQAAEAATAAMQATDDGDASAKPVAAVRGRGKGGKGARGRGAGRGRGRGGTQAGGSIQDESNLPGSVPDASSPVGKDAKKEDTVRLLSPNRVVDKARSGRGLGAGKQRGRGRGGL